MNSFDDLDELYREINEAAQPLYTYNYGAPLQRDLLDMMVDFTGKLTALLVEVGIPATYLPHYEDYTQHVLVQEEGLSTSVVVTLLNMYAVNTGSTKSTQVVVDYLTDFLVGYRWVLSGKPIKDCRTCMYSDDMTIEYCGLGLPMYGYYGRDVSLEPQCRSYTPRGVTA